MDSPEQLRAGDTRAGNGRRLALAFSKHTRRDGDGTSLVLTFNRRPPIYVSKWIRCVNDRPSVLGVIEDGRLKLRMILRGSRIPE